MKGSRSAVAALISLAVLAAALVVLGTLQYRWIGEMADAERQRIDFRSAEVRREGAQVELSTLEIKLLRYFVEQRFSSRLRVFA
jgi:hypothetical protein